MNQFKKIYKTFKKICTPAQLYFILGLIAILGSLRLNIKFNMTLLNVVILVLWTFLLNMICGLGWSSISWFLVLFPYVLLLFVIFLLPFVVKEGFFNDCKKEEKFNNRIKQKSRNTFNNRKKIESLINSLK